MRSLLALFPLLLIGAPLASAGSPAEAKAVREAYEKSLEAWSIRVQLAKTPEERKAVKTPEPALAAERMWSVISTSLDQPWVIEPAAWFVRLASPLVKVDEKGQAQPMFRPEIAKVLAAVEAKHLQSKDLAPMCMALVALGDQPSLALLRKIEAGHPDKAVAGVAALGVAMLGKNMGDDPRVMRERLSMLRKAIIDAADVKLDQTTVAALAEEELYIITNLSKGTVAPDLEGQDSGGRPMKLSETDGKVRVLVFWNSTGEGPDGLLDWVSALRRDERFVGKPFEVVGVNTDLREDLRKLQADGRADWPNFSDAKAELSRVYRVASYPTAYVLGPDRKIHYVGPMGTFAELTAYAVLDEL
ncbi:MAG: peroxiredoxin family protein [Akkermansiaceae bacterium]|jgi:peroxiredoxin|nr:peroxiredoxin family protein [Akkermansiaceae bacterium]